MAFTEQQLGQLNLMIGESIRRGLAEGLAAAPQPSPAAPAAAAKANSGDAQDDRRSLDEKIFKRLDSYGGDE